MSRRICCILGLMLASGTTGHAQRAVVVEPGARVRIASPVIGTRRQTARVLSVSRDTLVVQLTRRSDTVALAASDIRSLDRSVGTRRRFWRGLLIGTAAGAAVGAGIGAMIPAEKRVCATPDPMKEPPLWKCNPNEERDVNVAVGMLLVGAAGEIAGGVWGYRRTDRWARVRRSEWTARLSLVPSRHDGVAIRIAF